MWADFLAWFQSPAGARVLQTAIVPAAAILVAALLAAWIGRGVARAAIRQGDRDRATAAIAGLVAAARLAGDDAPEQRRRGARLRAEADVRVRLLPVKGADLAADWAAARIDAQPDAQAVDGLRDALVAWVRRPSKAKRLFAEVPQAPADPRRRSTADPAVAPEASTRPGAAPGVAPAEQAAPVVTGPAVTAVGPAAPVVAAADASPAPSGSRDAEAEQPAPPAWQRTRSGERLQQERASRQDEVAEELSAPTAPVQLQHAHRAPGAPVSDADDAVRPDAHLVARHAVGAQAAVAASADEPQPVPEAHARFARPTTTPDAAAPAAEAPAAPPVPPAPAAEEASQEDARPASPAWLDDYDDEAQVTRQNLDLRTPPPVSATAVRDRGPRGEDLVPRS